MDPVASGLVAGGCLMGFALCLALQATLRRLQTPQPQPVPLDAEEYHRRGRFWVTRIRRRWLVCEDARGRSWLVGEYALQLNAVRQCERMAKEDRA